MRFATAPLGEVAPARPISLVKDPDEVVWQVTLDHIKADTGMLLKREMKPFSKAGTSTHAFDNRHVLYSKLRPYLNKVLVPDEEGIGTTELVPMLPDPERLDRGYLAHYLMTQRFVAWITEHSSGAKMPRATMADFWAHEIPLPSLPEQKRIAAILDKADAIRRKRQQATELTDQFLRSVFLDIFGDPVTNPNGWKKVALGQLSKIRRGASPRPISKHMGGSVPWIKIGDGSKGNPVYLDSTKEHVTEEGAEKSVYLEPGTLIFANCGVSLGFARILKIGGCIHDGWLAIEDLDKQINNVFLLKWINFMTDYFRRIAPDGTQPNLNTGIMKTQEIFLPPITLQKQYERIVLQCADQLEALEELERQSSDLFASLSQIAFAGEL